MKTKIAFILSLILSGIIIPISGQDLSPKEIIRKADERFNGEESSVSLMAMTIVRPTWERTLEFKNWTIGKIPFPYTDHSACKGQRTIVSEKGK